MSASIDTIRTEEPTADPDDEPHRKTLDVSDVDPDRVTAYARATAAEGHPELYFERKGGRTFLVAP
jgi:hypothetical protein